MTQPTNGVIDYTLLFVDDEESILRSLDRFFRGEYRVLTASNAQEAIAILERQPVHIVVSDLRMPGMDGLELLRLVKERWPETIRMMLTGYGDVQQLMDDISSGVVYRFISKPWNDENLTLAIRLALQQYGLIQQIKSLQQSAPQPVKPLTEIMAAEQAGVADKRFTLLFVDDEDFVLKTLVRVFGRDEYQILTAESGEEALRLLEQEPVHLIVSDYRMPGMTGLQLLREVRQRWPETIRVMLTGYADVKGVMNDISEGTIYKFISKPWQNEELKMSVRLALRQFALIAEMKHLAAAKS